MSAKPVSTRRLAAVLGLGLASAACLALLALRRFESGNHHYAFLVWNLFLAWIPFVLAVLLYDRARAGGSRSSLGCLGLGWLLFLPNAPYLATDFVHVGTKPGMPVWFDAVLVASFAATGLLLGFASLWLVQCVVAGLVRRSAPVGRAAFVGWGFALVVLGLASIGVYAGRVFRLNSWDALVRPHVTLDVLAGGLATEQAAMWIVGMALALAVGYAVFCLTGFGRAAE